MDTKQQLNKLDRYALYLIRGELPINSTQEEMQCHYRNDRDLDTVVDVEGRTLLECRNDLPMIHAWEQEAKHFSADSYTNASGKVNGSYAEIDVEELSQYEAVLCNERHKNLSIGDYVVKENGTPVKVDNVLYSKPLVVVALNPLVLTTDDGRCYFRTTVARESFKTVGKVPKKILKLCAARNNTVKSSVCIGDVFENHGAPFIVIQFGQSGDVVVEFENGHVQTVTVSSLHTKIVNTSLKKKSTHNGYIGAGEYGRKSHPKLSNLWNSLLQKEKDFNLQIDNRWYNFQNFVEDLVKLEAYQHYIKGRDYTFGTIDFDGVLYNTQTVAFLPNDVKLFLDIIVKYKNRFAGITHGRKGYEVTVQGGLYHNPQTKLGRFDELSEAIACLKSYRTAQARGLAKAYRSVLAPNVYRLLADFDFRHIKNLPTLENQYEYFRNKHNANR